MIAREEIQRLYEPATADVLLSIVDAVKEVDDPDEQRRQGWRLLRAAFEDKADFIQSLNWIRLKDPDGGYGGISLLKLKKQQRYVYDLIDNLERQQRPVRLVILKARQQGISTFSQADGIYRILTRPNFRAAVVAHNKGASQEIFEISTRIINNLLFLPDMEVQRRDEIQTKAGAKYTVLTAGNEDLGRAMNAHWIHMSEPAFYENGEIVCDSVLQTIGRKAGTTVIFESTANGMANLMRDMWVIAMRGKSEWVPVFFPWFEEEEYRIPVNKEQVTEINDTLDEEERWLLNDGVPIWNDTSRVAKLSFDQIAWRRWCINTNCRGSIDKFHQEYPSYPDEAFLSTGRPVFDQKKLQALLARAREPIMRGELVARQT